MIRNNKQAHTSWLAIECPDESMKSQPIRTATNIVYNVEIISRFHISMHNSKTFHSFLYLSVSKNQSLIFLCPLSLCVCVCPILYGFYLSRSERHSPAKRASTR